MVTTTIGGPTVYRATAKLVPHVPTKPKEVAAMLDQTASTSVTAPTPKVLKTPLCIYCGADDEDMFDVISRHRTSVGTTVWLRCSCTALQVRVVSGAGTQLVARGRS